MNVQAESSLQNETQNEAVNAAGYQEIKDNQKKEMNPGVKLLLAALGGLCIAGLTFDLTYWFMNRDSLPEDTTPSPSVSVDEVEDVEDSDTVYVEEDSDDSDTVDSSGGEETYVMKTMSCEFLSNAHEVTFQYPSSLSFADTTTEDQPTLCSFEITKGSGTLTFWYYGGAARAVPETLESDHVVVGTYDGMQVARNPLSPGVDTWVTTYGAVGETEDVCTSWSDTQPGVPCLYSDYLPTGSGSGFRAEILGNTSKGEQNEILEVFDDVVMSIVVIAK